MEVGGTRKSWDADTISEEEFTKERYLREEWKEGQIWGGGLKFCFGVRCPNGRGTFWS